MKTDAVAPVVWTPEKLTERWFPAKYSLDDEERLEERQFACKEFTFGPVRTKDAQERRTTKIKQIPRIEYLEHWIEALVRESDVINPKVRRQIITLSTENGYGLWRAMEAANTDVVILFNNLKDGERHIDEDIVDVAWKNLPEFLRKQYVVSAATGGLWITHRRLRDEKTGEPYWAPWDSAILPYASGASHGRGHSPSVVIWDEFSTHPRARQAMTALRFSLIGRGKGDIGQIVTIGTVNPGTSSGRYFRERYGQEDFRRCRMAAKYGIEVLGEQGEA